MSKSNMMLEYAKKHDLVIIDIPLSKQDMSDFIAAPIMENNNTGCLDPDTHQGGCGYTLRNCPNKNCINKLQRSHEVENDECDACCERREVKS